MIAGVDCSSKAIHIVFLDDDKKFKKAFKCESKKILAGDRFLEIVLEFKKKIRRHAKNLKKVVVEKELYIQNPATTVAIAKVVAGVELTLAEQKIPYVLMTVTQWKKQSMKDPWAKKENIQAAARKQFGKRKEFEDQNFCDACMIARAGFEERTILVK